MIKWAGWLLVVNGVVHTVAALTLEGAARYAGDWFGGHVWWDDLSAMSPASSALWLSLESFGPPLALLGVVVLWLDRRGDRPPAFLGWALIAWAVVDGIVLLPKPWPIGLVAGVLVVVAARRGGRVPAERSPSGVG